MELSEFYEKVAQLCFEFRGSITSGIRTKARNTAVGGKPRSKHLTGFAFDVVLDSKLDLPQFLVAVKRAGLRYLDEGDHIHVQI